MINEMNCWKEFKSGEQSRRFGIQLVRRNIWTWFEPNWTSTTHMYSNMCINITFGESKGRINVFFIYYIAKTFMFESMHDVYFDNHTSAGNAQNFGQ